MKKVEILLKWRQRVTVEMVSFVQRLLGRAIRDADKFVVPRARAALPYLETALHAGYKTAAKILMDAHLELARLCKAQLIQFKGMKSI